MRFNRTKTWINARLESKTKEKSQEVNNTKISPLKMINKVLPLQNKIKIEENKNFIDTDILTVNKSVENSPIKEKNANNINQYEESNKCLDNLEINSSLMKEYLNASCLFIINI